MASITNLTASTELEAVNAMLAAVGQSPIANADTAQSADVKLALNTLRNATREVQTMGWRFNTRLGMQVAPAASISWQDTANVTTAINVFKPRPNLVKFRLTRTADQAALDAVLAPSERYTESSKPVLVIFDRGKNRDGFEQARFPYLYLDAVLLYDFELMPEAARRYVTVTAARRFAQDAVGSAELSSFKQGDELMALRTLKRDEGDAEDYNLFNNADVLRHLGGRPRYSAGALLRTTYPGAR